MSRFITGSEPYLLPSGRTGCILLHGFTSMPEETRQLGEFLAEKGVTTLGVCLSGHASHPNDLRHTHWTDWLLDVETAAALLSNITDRVFIIGQSMGGILSLIFSTEYPVAGIVTVSTPALPVSPRIPFGYFFQKVFFPTIFKDKVKGKTARANPRQPNYPAYAYYPSRIHTEVHKLQNHLSKTLQKVTSPALIIQSRDDPWVPSFSAEYIYKNIQSQQKSIFWMEKAGHSVLLSEDRLLAFMSILNFIQENEPA